jgi:4-hydroxyphenylpyruvate dioxygenase
MASAVRSAGVRVHTVTALYDWALPDDPDPTRALEALIEAAVAVGATLIVCVAPLRLHGLPPAEDVARYASERLIALEEVTAKAGVRLTLEQVGRSSTRPDMRSGIRKLSDALAIVTKTRDVGLVIDSFNLATAEVDFAEIAGVPHSCLAMAHVADLDRETGTRCLPCHGVLDLHAFIQALEAAGYDGPVSLEIFPRVPWPDASAFARAATDSLSRLLARDCSMSDKEH